MLVSIFVIYVSSSQIGSPDRMYELLREAAQLHPVAGNAEGSYLTMKSPDGAYIGLIFIGAGFASAVDSQLFQKAIAADPASTFLGYMVGGLCWFTIPFVLATTYGLTAAAVEHLPSFPTYPHRMSQSEVTSGMAMPYAAVAVMGKSGAGAIILMMFMAVTSAMSSETIATSTLITYDAYKAYFAPQATSAMLVRVSRIAVISFGIIVAAVAVAFNHAGFSVNYLINAIGIFVDSAIVPMAGTILWKKQSGRRYRVSTVLFLCSHCCLAAHGLFACGRTEYRQYESASPAGSGEYDVALWTARGHAGVYISETSEFRLGCSEGHPA
ncbi:hypothetical protein MAP00_002859 [Monascus purpureus]|nr:hypothetical protein MAP00_002859 [Monascus purpureus]